MSKTGRALLSLSEAKVGGSYKIVRVEASGLVKRRVMDLGLLPGVVVRVMRKAPLGDPLEVSAKGHPISLRLDEARFILVEEVEGDSSGFR
ncbi:MAG: FeoA family protein [Infirmifilum sp.]